MVTNGDSKDTAAGQQPLSADDYPELGLEHVHALGVDPADGVLYAASHFGIFRIPATGKATRVANRYQDTMGFTITGPNTFLGSGHPDLRENLPSRLGLIESTDGANTWVPLSLSGKADFHTLHAVHGRVYGYESGSGTFMVSPDRVQWETRSTRPMRDFVVDPQDPENILATTSDGLLRSTDGGRTWAAVAGAPTLVVVAWASPDTLYGIDTDGAVHHSRDGGAGWTERGTIAGEPEALTVDVRNGAQTLYVAAERGILQSTDGGTSFTTRYADRSS
ncbi:F510_1955 family glycosylhydrolase [Sporichthya sp.]|uniref:F510_1955 family glycosylhydrolase n=1 Tax=Sporichthya sp. TaxID=65475 RepID=UPI0017F0AF71|nr:exo-alpha-sialidase [Sporichthya sp.]MBA3741622.1 exo-alpha-sialidase [Sporichthya sp.]